jgi:hypothetical protein
MSGDVGISGASFHASFLHHACSESERQTSARLRNLAAHIAPETLRPYHPHMQEGAGKTGRRLAPMARVQ